MPAESMGIIVIGVVVGVSLVSVVLYLRTRPIDLTDPTSGDRVLPEVLDGDAGPSGLVLAAFSDQESVPLAAFLAAEPIRPFEGARRYGGRPLSR